jgi:hypothetical protein
MRSSTLLTVAFVALTTASPLNKRKFVTEWDVVTETVWYSGGVPVSTDLPAAAVQKPDATSSFSSKSKKHFYHPAATPSSSSAAAPGKQYHSSRH